MCIYIYLTKLLQNQDAYNELLLPVLELINQAPTNINQMSQSLDASNSALILTYQNLIEIAHSNRLSFRLIICLLSLILVLVSMVFPYIICWARKSYRSHSLDTHHLLVHRNGSSLYETQLLARVITQTNTLTLFQQ